MNLLKEYKNNSDVTINTHNDLHSISYKSLGVDWNNELTRMARGLVLDNNGNIVARPFTKFFNLNELVGRSDLSSNVIELCKKESGPIEVTNKLDGSLVIAFYHNGLQFASSGSLSGDHVKMFQDAAKRLWSKETYEKVKELSKTHTLLFEYTSPSNIIVLEYEVEKLTLVGIRETKTGKDYTMKESKKLTKDFGVEYAETLNFNSLKDVLSYIETQKGIEGVVVMFTNTRKRVKIKTEEYFKEHKSAKEFRIYGSLTKSNIEYIENNLFSDNQGLLDDKLAKYRNSKVYESVVLEADTLIARIIDFIKTIEALAQNADEAFSKVEHIKFYETINNSQRVNVNNYVFDTLLLTSVRDRLNGFHSKQKDYFKIKETVKETSYKRLMKVINKEVGVVRNYNHLISAKSFIYNVLDKRELWDSIKNKY